MSPGAAGGRPARSGAAPAVVTPLAMGRALARRRTADRARRVAGLGAVLLATGCAQLLGVDDYRQREDSDAAVVEGCGPLEAPSRDGCTPVGVERCADGFAPDGRGGCEAQMAEECGAGRIAPPGRRQCQPLGTCAAGAYWIEQDSDDGVTLLYVSQDATAGGDGASPESPFRTIGEALAAAAGPTTIRIARGEYVESIELEGEKVDRVRLRGVCFDETLLRAPDESSPAVRVSGPIQVTLEGLRIAGGSAGLLVDAAASVTVVSTWIAETEGPGILMTDREGPPPDAEAGLYVQGDVLIEGARGAAIAVHGGRVLQPHRPERGGSGSLIVRGTRALEDGREGYGIALYPSAARTDGAGLPEARPSELELRRAVIEGSAGAGLLVEGSGARVSGTVIRDSGPNGLGEGRGIVVRRRPLGHVAASLELSRSIVESSHDVGILVEDSPRPLLEQWPDDPGLAVTIEDSVIRRSGAPGGCVGNGLRVRSDGEVEGATPSSVVLRRSLVESSREAGVLVVSGRTEVRESLVRDTEAGPCGDSADGVAVYGDPAMPAEVLVMASRIEASGRAGVANFGGRATVESTAIDGCSTPVHAGDRGAPGEIQVNGSACACGGATAGCAPGDAALPPALLGGNGCEDLDGVCYRACFDWTLSRLSPESDPTRPTDPVPRVVFWAPEELRRAPALSDDDGCVEWGGLPPGEERLFAGARAGALPVAGRMRTGRQHGVPFRFIVNSNFIWQTFQDAHQEPLDPAAASLAGTFVCRRPPEPDPGSPPRVLCLHEGVPGVRLEAVSAVGGQPVYVGDAGGFPLEVVTTTTFSYGGFVNAEPGEVVLRLVPPPDASLDCDTVGFDGWGVGEMIAPDQVRFPARPGFGAFALVFCDPG